MFVKNYSDQLLLLIFLNETTYLWPVFKDLGHREDGEATERRTETLFWCSI